MHSILLSISRPVSSPWFVQELTGSLRRFRLSMRYFVVGVFQDRAILNFSLIYLQLRIPYRSIKASNQFVARYTRA
jgi:hypothetical protein